MVGAGGRWEEEAASLAGDWLAREALRGFLLVSTKIKLHNTDFNYICHTTQRTSVVKHASSASY